MSIRLIAGDCLLAMREMADRGETVHAVVCDPPYHLTSTVKRFGAEDAAPARSDGPSGVYARANAGFMGKKWDGGDIAFRPETWRLAWDLLPPGGHLIAFGGTRTFHRMAVAIEDAGFEIRDTLMWLYGTGFPKSHDVASSIDKAARGVPHGGADPTSPNHGRYKGGTSSDNPTGQGFGAGPGAFMAQQGVKRDRSTLVAEAAEWEGWGTALKPAWEPIILARKPLAGTVAANVLQHACGALNIDGCRVPTDENLNGGAYAEKGGRGVSPSLHAGSGMNVPGATTGRDFVQPAGRWPANVLHDGSDEVEAAFAAFGERPGQMAKASSNPDSPRTRKVYGKLDRSDAPMEPRGDSGSASRFFFNTGGVECDPANTAGAYSSLQSGHAVSALSDAATSARPGAVLLAGSYQAASTSVTASEFGMLCASVTEAIQSFDRRCSLGLPPVRHTVTLGLATCAVQPGPTGTTTITASLLRCAGSADLVTFSITPPNTDPGEAGSLAGSRFHYSAKATAADRAGSKHPTVKPVALMRWLVRLVTPPGGTVLDPFAGSGTTGAAAVAEGMRAVLIEAEPEYQADIQRRIDATPAPRRTEQLEMFGRVRR